MIRAHRIKAGLTQQQLAAKAGLSLATLRDLEQGRRSRPRPRSLAALGQALDFDPAQAADLASHAATGRRAVTAARQALPLGAGQPDLDCPAGWRPGLWLAILGPLEASLDGRLVSLGPPMRRAVLGMLAVDPGAVVRRDLMIDVLWGQQVPSTAVSLVQAHVSRLRKLSPEGGDFIASVAGGYRLQVTSEQLDLFTFRALAASAEASRAAGDDPAATDFYERALELWRGEPLADLDALADHPGVAVLRHQLTDVLLRYAELACRLGLHDRVLPRLHALAAAEPLNERVHARLMIALAGAGQQAAAVRVYEDLRGRLDREFAIYPSEELVTAHLRVLRQDLPVLSDSYEPRQPAHVVPRQLPAAPRYFTGRDTQRRALFALLNRASPDSGAVALAALTGMAGIGKTALAVSWAHQVASRFPDGQLFADLRGFSPSDNPLAPAAVLHDFLSSLGMPPTRIPPDVAGRAALYRSMLASRRMLVVLDNASDAEQVRPLLPGSPGCLVLVTSRCRLIGLAASESACLLPLGGLTAQESHNLLTRVLGARRVVAEPVTVDELIVLCARLPLALRNVIARAVAHPALPLATLVAEMRNERGRLDALETGETATSVRVAFSRSHARLSEPAARILLVLGMYPGSKISVPASAALAALDRTLAHAALAELCDEHLVTELASGHYGWHELLRAYAAEVARRQLSEKERRSAVYRMLDYYLHTANAASVLLFPHLTPLPLSWPRPGVCPERIHSTRQAAEWVESERHILLAVISQAAEGGFCPHSWELPWAAGWFFCGDECWRSLAAAQEIAVEIARGHGDLGGEALARHHLAWLRFWLGEDEEACRHLSGAIELLTRLSGGTLRIPPGLTAQEARSRARIPEALVHIGQILRLYQMANGRRAIGYRREAISAAQA